MGNRVTGRFCCFAKSVRVMSTDGNVLLYPDNGELTVGDVLKAHPRHYLTELGQKSKLSRSSMLRDEEVLKPGTTYVLQPLPLLFSVGGGSRTAPRPSGVSCWRGLCISIPGDSSFEESSEYSYGHGEEEGSRFWMFSSRMGSTERKLREQITNSPQKNPRSPINLQKLLKSAEMECKELVELNKAWRPDLESITEEKSPPPLLTLAAIMKMDIEQEEREYRGNTFSAV